MLLPQQKANGPASPPNDSSSSVFYSQAITLSILALVACLLAIPPLILQIRSSSSSSSSSLRNLSTVTLILSIALANLQNTINPLVWHNDDISAWYSGVGLCDVEAKLQVGLSVAIPASATCICRNLAGILSVSNNNAIEDTNRLSSSLAHCCRRLMLTFDVTLCIVLPLYAMCVHILVQPYRYYIHGISGCQYSLSRTWPTVPLLLVWPALLSLLGAAYSLLIVARLLQHGRAVDSIFVAVRLSRARFSRVFFLSAAFVLVYTPCALYIYVRSLEMGSRGAAWRWSEVHPPDWARLIIRIPSGGTVWFDRWVQVASGYVVFAVFGLGTDARATYRRWWTRTTAVVVVVIRRTTRTRNSRGSATGRSTSGLVMTERSATTATTITTRQVTGRHDSVFSLGEMSVDEEPIV